MLLPHPFSISIETRLHYYFLIDNYLLIGKSFVSIWSVYFRYIFCIWYFKLFSFVYVFTASVYFQFIIHILSVSETLSCFRLINHSLLLVYFLDIFGIWSCTCIFFLFHSKRQEYFIFIWYHLIFHLVSFDFNWIK